jgi:ribosomal protein S18 acetylase RimI-like enzyme
MPADEALLDNPVYAALSSAHARFAVVRGNARRYPADVAPFLGLPLRPTAEDWHDAAALVVPGGYAAILHGGAALPAGWEAVTAFDVVQMIGERASGCADPELLALGSGDVPEMLELVAETQPGPFLRRTIELGAYFGIRRDGGLVAMAGERLRFEGWTEISAVCTAPGYRGAGMASRLVRALIADIERRSERVFLHVLASNTGAIRLYESLGFRVRRTATITVMSPSPSPASVESAPTPPASV